MVALQHSWYEDSSSKRYFFGWIFKWHYIGASICQKRNQAGFYAKVEEDWHTVLSSLIVLQ